MDHPVENLNDNPEQQRFFVQDIAEHGWYGGYPLSNPEPEIGVDGKPVAHVEIGDVGYISHEGKFIRLFNIHLDPGVNGQPAIEDLPVDFRSIPPDLRSRDIRPVCTSGYAHVPEVPESWEEKISSWGEMILRPIRGERTRPWRPNAPGAMFAVDYDPRGSFLCINAENTLHYVQYMQKNARSWHEFVSQRLDLELDDLILVTGTDRASTWATAVHDGKKIRALDFGPKAPYPDEDARDQAAAFWRDHLQAILDRTNVKPEDDGEDRHNEEIKEIPESKGLLRGAGHDQTLFIRYVRAKHRMRQTAQLNTKRQSKAGTSSEYLLEKNLYFSDEYEPASPARRERLKLKADRLEPVLDHILTYSNADIAVAHSCQVYRIPSLLEKLLCARLTVKDGVGALSMGWETDAQRLNFARALYNVSFKGKLVAT